MPVIEVSSRRELLMRRVIFTLKSISYRDQEEIYRLPNGEKITASLETPKKFKTLQTILWVYAFPIILIHELSHIVADHLLSPWDRPYRVTRKKRMKIFLTIFVGPLSEIIICLIGAFSNIWTPLRIYLVSSTLIPLVIWTTEDYQGLLQVVGLLRRFKILYGFHASRDEWYLDLFDRFDKIRILRRYAQSEQSILQKVEDFKKRFKTDLVEREDLR